MFDDVRGLPLTTRVAGAAEGFNAAVEDLLEFRPRLMDTLRGALARESQFVMGNVLFGAVLRMAADDALLPRARKHLASARTAAEGATPREQAHVEALRRWLAGDLHEANRIYEAILIDTPEDLLALKLLTHNYLWLGDRENLRDAPARALKRIGPDLPGYGYFLGAHAFGLEECGDYKAAERAGRAAVDYHPGDLWAVHAVAHVFEMQCRIQEGLAWIARLSPSWSGRGNFVYHLWWHRALLLFELEQWDAVLALYDKEIRQDKTEFAADLQNAASLLWRLELRGVKVGGRWEELADLSEKRLSDMAHPFNSVHFVMALLRAGRAASAERHLDAIRHHIEKGRSMTPSMSAPRAAFPRGGTPAGQPSAARSRGAEPSDALVPVFEDVAIPVCEGLAAFHDEVYSRATERLMKAFGKLQTIGGSHAQRDFIVLTLIQAAQEGGYLALARDLLAARTHSRPASADAWHGYGHVLELTRNIGEATIARARGDAILNRSKGVT